MASKILLFLVTKSCLTLLQPYGLQTAELLCPWDFSGKNTEVGCLFPSPWNIPDPGMKAMSPAWQADSLLLRHQGSPDSA